MQNFMLLTKSAQFFHITAWLFGTIAFKQILLKGLY